MPESLHHAEQECRHTRSLSRSQRTQISSRASANSDLELGKHSPQNLSLTAFIVSQVNTVYVFENSNCVCNPAMLFLESSQQSNSDGKITLVQRGA